MPDTTPTIAPLEGKTTIDDEMFFEPERLSYQSADAIAARIAETLKENVHGQTVVIAGTALLSDFANLQAVYLTLRSVAKDYESIATVGRSLAESRLLAPAESLLAMAHESLVANFLSTAIAPATSVISATLGLLSFFREDVEYHGAKTTMETLAFEIALAAKLKSAGAGNVIVPDLMVISTARIDGNSISVLLAHAQKAKAQAWEAAGPMISELLRIEGELDQAAREKNQSRFDELSLQVSDLRRDMQPISEPLSRSDQRLADLQNQWNKVDEASGLTLLARLLRAEILQAEKHLYLHAKVISSGGHHRVSRSLFRTLFLGDGLTFAGGAIVRWALLKNDGSVTRGGILTGRQNSSSRSSVGSRESIVNLTSGNEPSQTGQLRAKERKLVEKEFPRVVAEHGEVQ
jgi:hypothetical protein